MRKQGLFLIRDNCHLCMRAANYKIADAVYMYFHLLARCSFAFLDAGSGAADHFLVNTCAHFHCSLCPEANYILAARLSIRRFLIFLNGNMCAGAQQVIV